MTAEPRARVTILRRLVPIAAGGAVTLLLTAVTDSWLSARGLLPAAGVQAYGTGSLAMAAAYRGVFATVGCHLAARLAPRGHPRLPYALALGTVLLMLSVGAASAMWGQVPPWYPLIAIAMTLPCALIGGATAVRVMAARERDGQPR